MIKFLQFIMIRAVMSIVTLLIVSFIVFSMMELVPGNCAERYIAFKNTQGQNITCLLYTSPSPRDVEESRMPSSA